MEQAVPAPTFHSRALKLARRPKSRRLHSEEAAKYRDPFLGIEVTLERRLADNDENYGGSPRRRIDILIDALEDIAAQEELSFFRSDLLNVCAHYRRPLDQRVLQIAQSDFCVADDNVKRLRDSLASKEADILNLEAEIERTSARIEALRAELESVKNHVYYESDTFAYMRKTNAQLSDLLTKCDAVFSQRTRPEIQDERTKDLEAENTRLKKVLVELKAELHVVERVTQRIEAPPRRNST
jgi:hypothetical protein